MTTTGHEKFERSMHLVPFTEAGTPSGQSSSLLDRMCADLRFLMAHKLLRPRRDTFDDAQRDWAARFPRTETET